MAGYGFLPPSPLLSRGFVSSSFFFGGGGGGVGCPDPAYELKWQARTGCPSRVNCARNAAAGLGLGFGPIPLQQ